MITISNLRKESVTSACASRIICDISCNYSESTELWFSVPEEYADWLTDEVYDAFMVAMLYPAMYYGENIDIKGNVSKRLHHNLCRYVQSVVMAYRPDMREIGISVEGYDNVENQMSEVGTAFSAGIDAFSTFFDNFENEKDPQFRISALFFFNLGSHGGGGQKARDKFHTRFDYLKSYSNKFQLPFIPLDSNLFDFYLNYWEFDAGIFCRAAGALVFQKAMKRYYIASDNSYGEHMNFLFNRIRVDLSSLSENYLHPLLSTERMELITDGSQFSRTEKTERLVDYEPMKTYLNVCVGQTEQAANCCECSKCLRTLFALDAMGKLDDYKGVFDLDKYKKQRFAYACYVVHNELKDVYCYDNVRLAKKYGMKLPNRFMAAIVFNYNRVVNKLKRIMSEN